MSNRIDAAVYAVELAARSAPSGRALGKAERTKLGEGDDTVLPRCEVRQPAISSTGFGRFRYVGCRFRPTPRHDRDRGGRDVPYGAAEVAIL
jgi:hypothetical protein